MPDTEWIYPLLRAAAWRLRLPEPEMRFEDTWLRRASDLQANIVVDLIRRGLNVHAFNQRSIAGILDMVRMLGAIVDAGARADELVTRLETHLAETGSRAVQLPKRPRVFFEEWDVPLICGIGWVSELIEIASGVDIFVIVVTHGPSIAFINPSRCSLAALAQYQVLRWLRRDRHH